MALRKLTTTDAFVVTDVPDAPASGLVRMGKKILQSSAMDLARSATYSFAAFGVERGGASAGINAVGDAAIAALEAFLEETADLVDLDFHSGKGVPETAFDSSTTTPDAELNLTSVVEAARWAAGGSFDNVTAAIEGVGSSPMAQRLADELARLGVELVHPDPAHEPWAIWGSEVDLILAGSKPGVLNHQGAGTVSAKAIVPWGPLPVTTKAYVMLERAGTTVVPDFVGAAGGLVARHLEFNLTEAIPQILDACSAHPEGVLMGACVRAEEFLTTWTDFSPFGRPLAA